MSAGTHVAVVPQVAPSGSMVPDRERLREELDALQNELAEVEEQLATVKKTVYGLSLVFGPELCGPSLLNHVQQKSAPHVRGLTDACRSAVMNAELPCSVSSICNLITAINPALLIHHRNPRASVMTVLRNLAKRGEVIRGMEKGRSVWQWLSPEPRKNRNHSIRAMECSR